MNQDWERWGRDIRNIVQDAVESQDFRRLNDTISNTINDAIFNLKENIRRGAGEPGGPPPVRPAGKFREQPQRPLVLFARKRGTALLGGIILTAGSMYTLVCLLTLTAGIIQTLRGGGLAQAVALFILVCMTGAGLWIIRTGKEMLGRTLRFPRYIHALQGKAYCNISDISERTGEKPKRVLKDLKKMISDRWFVQGHLDEQEACLMVTDAAYNEYRRIRQLREEQKKAEQERQKAARQTRQAAGEMTEVQRVIEKGKWYVNKIRECNDAIPGEEISRKIDRIELLVRRIFERVEEDPDAVDDIRKLMEYYLPTTVKLLEAYEQLDGQPEAGENIRQAKREIEKTLDTLNTAFEKLLDSLFEDVAWDISSDISVLETMLAQEGLTDDGFKRKE